MSNRIAILLQRNLDVFGENDPPRRRALIDEYYTEDCVFYDPNNGIYRGRDEIDRIAGVIKATHPDFQYQPIAEPDMSGDGGRIRWVSGLPGQAPAYAGTDFIVAREGRIAAIYYSSTICREHVARAVVETAFEVRHCDHRHFRLAPGVWRRRGLRTGCSPIAVGSAC